MGRTLAYNDPDAGARNCTPEPCGEGAAADRNVELLITDPRRGLDHQDGSDRRTVRRLPHGTDHRPVQQADGQVIGGGSILSEENR